MKFQYFHLDQNLLPRSITQIYESFRYLLPNKGCTLESHYCSYRSLLLLNHKIAYVCQRLNWLSSISLHFTIIIFDKLLTPKWIRAHFPRNQPEKNAQLNLLSAVQAAHSNGKLRSWQPCRMFSSGREIRNSKTR